MASCAGRPPRRGASSVNAREPGAHQADLQRYWSLLLPPVYILTTQTGGDPLQRPPGRCIVAPLLENAYSSVMHAVGTFLLEASWQTYRCNNPLMGAATA